MMRPRALLSLFVVGSVACAVATQTPADISQAEMDVPWEVKVDMKPPQKVFEGCNSNAQSVRHVADNFFTDEDVSLLLQMMQKGMASSPQTGGPTILDVNSGYLKDGDGLVRVYHENRGRTPVGFSELEMQTYGTLFRRIRDYVMKVNHLDSLHFTYPTFVARLVGNAAWEPKEIHDEYWHPHVDKDNTGHYDYSGLVYLSDYGSDFTGGEFSFLDGESTTVVEPRKGRLITFSSGKENLHRVAPVKTGVRYTLSMWFTCDPSMEYTRLQSAGRLRAYVADPSGSEKTEL